jgi:hypothetical protein
LIYVFAIAAVPGNRTAARLSPLPGILGLLGGAAMIVAIFLNWYRLTASAGPLTQRKDLSSWEVMKHPNEGRVLGHSTDWLRYTEYVGAVLAVLIVVVALVLLIRSISAAAAGGGGLLIVLAVLALLYIGYRLLLGPANYLAFGDITVHLHGVPVKGSYERLEGEFIFLAGAILALMGGLLGRRRPVVVAAAATGAA